MALADAVERRIAVFLDIRSRCQIKTGAVFEEIFPCQILNLVFTSLIKLLMRSKSFEQLLQIQADFQYQRWEFFEFYNILLLTNKPNHKSLKDFIRPFGEVFSVESTGLSIFYGEWF